MARRILLVDDCEVIRRCLRRLLETYGFDICGEAADGQEGVDAAQLLLPDAIILDLQMPVMDGIEAARVLHVIMPEATLLMYTSCADATVSTQAGEAGIQIVLNKLDPIADLVTTLRDLPERRAA